MYEQMMEQKERTNCAKYLFGYAVRCGNKGIAETLMKDWLKESAMLDKMEDAFLKINE